MKIVWNQELKRLALILSAFFGIGILALNCYMAIYANHARAEYNHLLAAVFGNMQEAYPDAAEEELVWILNGQGNEKEGEEILAQYGVLAEYGSASFVREERQLAVLRISVNAFFLLFFISNMLLLYAYFGKRQKRVSGLTTYMASLNRERYTLEIEDNADDELSGLKNEIYKLTVLLKEQADRALEQKKALADAMADISHQLKTPLTSATVLLDNLTENPGMDQLTRQRFLREVTRQLTGMSWLVTTILKLSRIDAGVVVLEESWTDGRELVEDALQRLEIPAEWKGIVFDVKMPEGMGLYADRKWMGEALMNIVKNAIEHSPEQGVIEIAGEENEVYTQIAVRNQGGAITEEERRNLFRRFFIGNSAREDSVGIGLALAKEIVEKQDGHITVESSEEKGTEFLFRFLKK